MGDSESLAGAESSVSQAVLLPPLEAAVRSAEGHTTQPFEQNHDLYGAALAEASPERGQLSLPDDRLRYLEKCVSALTNQHEEIKPTRVMWLQGSFTLSASAGPESHVSCFRRRYILQNTATTHALQITMSDRIKGMLGCATHVQGSNGLGVSKLWFGAASDFSSQTTAQTTMHFMESTPEFNASISHAVTPNCTVQPRVSVSSDDLSVSLTVDRWITRVLCGQFKLAFGEDAGVSVSILRRPFSLARKFEMKLQLSKDGMELTSQLKYKPCENFSVTIAPTFSFRGWTVNLGVSKTLHKGLTKLQWAFQFRRCNATLKFSLRRSGVRFNFPIELWPSTAGLLPLPEFGLASALWMLPPLMFRIAHLIALNVRRPKEKIKPPSPRDTSDAAVVSSRERELIKHEAQCRYNEETACKGLVIMSALYGDPEAIKSGENLSSIIDVTNCLMARVHHSRMNISSVPKSSLLGFHNLCLPHGKKPVLVVRYIYGEVVYEQTFANTDALSLP